MSTTPAEKMREAGEIESDEYESRASKLRRFDVLCSQVEERIFLGSDTVARDLPLLRSHGVTHVLNAAGVACHNYHEGELEYKTMYLYDSNTQDIACFLYEAISYIHAVLSGGVHAVLRTRHRLIVEDVERIHHVCRRHVAVVR